MHTLKLRDFKKTFRLSGHHKYFPKSEHKIKTTFGLFDSFVLFPTCTCSGKLYKSVIRCKYMVDLVHYHCECDAFGSFLLYIITNLKILKDEMR